MIRTGQDKEHGVWPTRLGQEGGLEDSRTGHEIHLEIEDDLYKKKYMYIYINNGLA